MVLATAICNAAKRVPLIKFRKGGPVMSESAGSGQSQTAGAPGAAGNVIEDWELPPRYRRKAIDPVEMEYINRGGPA